MARSPRCATAGLLDDAGVEVEHLSIHTPDLDDVFFAVTGRPDRGGAARHDSDHLHRGDSATMLRRNLRRLRRYPSMTVLLIGMPIVFLLLFVYVFGGQLSHGLGGTLAGGHAGRAGYLNYVTPGILILTVAAGSGHHDRRRDGHDRRHHRPVPHHGHRARRRAHRPRPGESHPDPGEPRGRHRYRRRARLPTDRRFLEWLAAIGVLALFAVALIWLATALGLAAKSVETASNTPMFLILLVFLGSGFVPPPPCRQACSSSPDISPSHR